MVCNVAAFVTARGKLRVMPNYCGSRWEVVSTIVTACRNGSKWVYGHPVPLGTVLEFAGWAGTDRDEPFAGFTSPDMPGWTVYLPPAKLGEWCRQIEPADGHAEGEGR